MVPSDRRRFVDAFLAEIGTADPVERAANACGISVLAMEAQLGHPQVAAVLQRVFDREEMAVEGELETDDEFSDGDDTDAIDGQWVLRKLVDIAEFDVADFLVEHPVTGEWHMMVTDANRHLLKHLKSFKLQRIVVNGVGVQTIELTQVDRLKTLELIGRHASVRAWLDDKQQANLNATVADIRAGRDRLAKHKQQESDDADNPTGV